MKRKHPNLGGYRPGSGRKPLPVPHINLNLRLTKEAADALHRERGDLTPGQFVMQRCGLGMQGEDSPAT